MATKEEVETVEGYNEERKKSIITTFYSSLEYPDYLFANVLHYNSDLDISESKSDAFISSNVLLDATPHKTSVKGGGVIKLLDFVQLFRYDPREQSCHINNLANIPEEEIKLYKQYFGYSCHAPHFHFASNTNAGLNGNPTSLAINLYNLIRYIEDLMYSDNEELNKFNLGLPFLKIKQNPQLYQTTTNTSFLELLNSNQRVYSELFYSVANVININKAELTKKIGSNMLNATTSSFCGLQAVYIDLILLAGLHIAREKLSVSSTDEFVKFELNLATKIFTYNYSKQKNRYDINYFVNRITNYERFKEILQRNFKKSKKHLYKGDISVWETNWETNLETNLEANLETNKLKDKYATNINIETEIEKELELCNLGGLKKNKLKSKDKEKKNGYLLER